MKGILRALIFHLIALWLATQVFSGGFILGGGVLNLVIAAAILAALNLLLKPILKLLFLPINALTLGLFSIVINALVFFIFIKVVPHATVSAWTFPGLSFQSMTLPSTELSFWLTLLVISLFMSLITNLLFFLVK